MASSRRLKRYYSLDDLEVGVTPSQLKRLGRQRQIEHMAHWFRRNFEDPSNETPYNSEEGGFIYVYGGPYDARDQLGDEFGSIVSDERIEEVTNLVEADGIFDWAPGRDHPDHERVPEEYEREQGPDDEQVDASRLDEILSELERGVRPRFGDAFELDQRKSIVGRLDALKKALEPAKPAHGGIGHNRPPPDADEPQVTVVDEIREAEATIRREVEKSEPNAVEVARAASRLSVALGWLAKKADVAAENFAKELGGSLGKWAGPALIGGIGYAVATVVPGLGEAIHSVITHVVAWLSNVTSPF